ncbi:hypothetical protein I79_020770 [Cricetulus griseus]|uniref:Secreted protein n=1 Tax=Cricetulus griseus TaxID=10029 RepID=G3IAY4_CRIGR|nr:hypothetical protein I79_020770 [Cricetulus griseus]
MLFSSCKLFLTLLKVFPCQPAASVWLICNLMGLEQEGLEQWFSTPMGSNDSFTGITYQIIIYVTIYITVAKLQL